ncbi:NB-ARC domain-containing protein [Candidatus Magnetaquicoccus inordinatus]|uniref:NB-ARC domain-containing protein n=1 Tax=Candidatus Magnetaquicoccus inordinatus TaxID=2496818 RepID=UPI00102CCC60|nr:NB-ARC domain-containing protein [Candidatus Magnetaquicoccus inordinatus]
MNFIPLNRMFDRINRSRESSDGEFFQSLILSGEFITKLIIAGLIASINEDPDRHRYRITYNLVRGNSIGEWVNTFEEAITGPAAQFIDSNAQSDLFELTKKVNSSNWQYSAVENIWLASNTLINNLEQKRPKYSLRDWISFFVRFRNKTRGHGAQLESDCSEAANHLFRSLTFVAENFAIFKRSWSYLHQNLSGKYRISYLGDTKNDKFEELKKKTNEKYNNGIYIAFSEPKQVDMLLSNADLTDFFCANGGFSDNGYELLSYITGKADIGDSSKYLTPITPLPSAETEGLGILDIQNNVFGNLPSLSKGYVNRAQLESKLYDVLTDDHHPIITLHGTGGIGKTQLALTVLHSISKSERFSVIIWFSARDIDLLPIGPKPVKAHIIDTQSISKEYIRLIGHHKTDIKESDFLSSQMTNSNIGPTLFVFDNFETVKQPNEVFQWIDACIRHPNKILITTRNREFNGDFQVKVSGMEEDESYTLIDTTSTSLNIHHLINSEYRELLYKESEGHPYVIKILLGEAAKSRTLAKPGRIIADKDKVLTALFERSYNQLSSGAKRVFLTLCRWKSVIPLVALKAVLLRSNNERFDVDSAVDELDKMSFVEINSSETDNQIFIETPLSASLFGNKKLTSDYYCNIVEADFKLLLNFGSIQKHDIKRGLAPSILRLLKFLSSKMEKDNSLYEEYKEVLEFIAYNYPETWLWIADLHDESTSPEKTEKTCKALKSFVENSDDTSKKQKAWCRLALIYGKSNDRLHEIHAWSESANTSLMHISEAANNINKILHDNSEIEEDVKEVIVLKVIDAHNQYLSDANGTHLSRLAWLYLNIGNTEKAIYYTREGLKRDSNNEHLIKLSNRLIIESEEAP